MRTLLAIGIWISLLACSKKIPCTFEILGSKDNLNTLIYGSGIARCGDIYIVSDQCPIMQRWSVSTGLLSDVQLAGLKPNARLRGMTSYKNRLYAVDSENRIAYNLDTNGQSRDTLSLLVSKPNGIAINQRNSVMYVMQRRAIYTYLFKSDSEGNIFELNRVDTFTVRIKPKLFRYTDICYDDDRYRLILLRAKRKTNVIDAMVVNQTNGKPWKTSLHEVSNVSSEVNACDGYARKMEGIIADGSSYFMISNGRKSWKSRGRAKRKALLIRIGKKLN